jgi:cytochrome c
MKKVFVTLALAGVLFACNSSSTDEKAAEKKDTVAATAPAPAENHEKALELITASDCLTCHKINEKVNGPSYAEVAAKYEPTEANIDSLANKIINGGSGVWGAMAMTPHPALAKEDAKIIVRYILSLKNQQQ